MLFIASPFPIFNPGPSASWRAKGLATPRGSSFQARIAQGLLEYLIQNSFEIETKHPLSQNTLRSLPRRISITSSNGYITGLTRIQISEDYGCRVLQFFDNYAIPTKGALKNHRSWPLEVKTGLPFWACFIVSCGWQRRWRDLI